MSGAVSSGVPLSSVVVLDFSADDSSVVAEQDALSAVVESSGVPWSYDVFDAESRADGVWVSSDDEVFAWVEEKSLGEGELEACAEVIAE